MGVVPLDQHARLVKAQIGNVLGDLLLHARRHREQAQAHERQLAGATLQDHGVGVEARALTQRKPIRARPATEVVAGLRRSDVGLADAGAEARGCRAGGCRRDGRSDDQCCDRPGEFHARGRYTSQGGDAPHCLRLRALARHQQSVEEIVAEDTVRVVGVEGPHGPVLVVARFCARRGGQPESGA